MDGHVCRGWEGGECTLGTHKSFTTVAPAPTHPFLPYPGHINLHMCMLSPLSISHLAHQPQKPNRAHMDCHPPVTVMMPTPVSTMPMHTMCANVKRRPMRCTSSPHTMGASSSLASWYTSAWGGSDDRAWLAVSLAEHAQHELLGLLEGRRNDAWRAQREAPMGHLVFCCGGRHCGHPRAAHATSDSPSLLRMQQMHAKLELPASSHPVSSKTGRCLLLQ